MSEFYDIDGSPLELEQWAEKTSRKKSPEEYGRVGKTDLVLDGVSLWVSTVWLGIDHNFMRSMEGWEGWGDPRPWIFETMVFGLPGDLEICYRYATWQEAEHGHLEVVRSLQEGRFRELLRGELRPAPGPASDDRTTPGPRPSPADPGS